MIETGEPGAESRPPVWAVIERARAEAGCDAAGEDRRSRPRTGVLSCQNERNAEADVQPELRLVRAGRLRLVPVSELQKWLESNAAPLFEDVA
jgi:hypothetical protein